MGTVSFGVGTSGCAGGDEEPPAEYFSFFVTSMAGLLELAPDARGFGGDLPDGGKRGVLGADALCTDENGRYRGSACQDWTSLTDPGEPIVGHSWAAQSGRGWLRARAAGGCGRSVRVQQADAPTPGDRTAGAGGGYGGFYCFASIP